METYIIALYVTFLNMVNYKKAIGRGLTLDEKAKMIQVILFIAKQAHEQAELEHRVGLLLEGTKNLMYNKRHEHV